MKQEDWAQRLRNQLADHEEAAPEGLWADIEAQLAKQQIAKRQSRIVPMWVRWSAAASLAAFLLSGGYLLWTGGDEPLAEVASPHQVAPSNPPARTETPATILPPTDRKETAKVISRQKASAPMEMTEYKEIIGNTDTLYHLEAQVHKQQETIRRPDSVTSTPDPQDVIRELEKQMAQASQHHRPGVSLNLYASNGFSDQSNRNGVLMSRSLLANYDFQAMARGGKSPAWLYNYEERQKHHQPLSVGLSLNIPISSRLSIATGMVYTLQRSDFTYVSNRYPFEKEQTLQYLGIPLSLRYRLWQWRGLGVYLTGGGQADYNINIDVEAGGVKQEVKRDRMQFSIQGALGVQYDFIPQLGVYVEPGIKHYFDNGSSIHNFFKDKPTDFNLQVGLRLHL